MNKIHKFLEKPKNRAIILLPPLLLLIIGDAVIFAYIFSGFSFPMPLLARYTIIGSSIWMILSLGIVLWSDYERKDLYRH